MCRELGMARKLRWGDCGVCSKRGLLVLYVRYFSYAPSKEDNRALEDCHDGQPGNGKPFAV